MKSRATLRPWLSYVRAVLVQCVDQVGSTQRLARRFGGQSFEPLPPRGGPEPRIASLARPIHFPQLGGGRLTIRELPPLGTHGFERLRRRARWCRQVVLGDGIDPDDRRVLVLGAAGAPLATRRHGDAGDAASRPRRHRRELASVRVRRAAHDALWGTELPAVSVLLATRRPSHLESALEQIASQRYPDLRVVVGLHGDGWPDELEAPATLEPVFVRLGSSVSLGEVLARLTSEASTELVTKWDDDDWYGRDHVADLVRAYRYSGADIVGKGAEFVHLQQCSMTIRRFSFGAESYSSVLAGGTLLTSRAWIERCGGWPSVRSSVDLLLLEASTRAGGRAYRTHGFQYVLRRNASQSHTWGSDDRHFLATATARRSGLDLGFADVCAPDQVAGSEAS